MLGNAVQRLALAAATLAVLCAAPAQAQSAGPLARAAIVAGTPADPARFAYFAALRSGGDTICGGALIAPSRVLTAAHCIDELKVGDEVVVGPSTRRTILHLAQHPRLTALIDAGRDPDGVLPYDAALVLLDAPVADVAPLRVAQAADSALYTPGALLVTIGMGSTDREGNGHGVLRYAEVRARSDADCKALLAPLDGAHLFDAPTMLCTTDPDGASPYRSGCHGDSGSPLLALAPDGAAVQVGIDDWGIACGFRNGDPENYVEVPAIAAFALSAAPVVRPEPRTRPRFTGVARVGRTVRCSKPRYNSPQPRRVARVFYVAGERRIVVARGASYRITRSLRGRRLSCAALASSAGGKVVTVAAASRRVR